MNTAELHTMAELTVGHVGTMQSEYRSEGVPFLRSQNILPHHIDLTDVQYISHEFNARLKKSELHPGNVVIVRTGKPGTAAVVPTWLPVANCSDLVVVRPSSRLDAHWLSYYINAAAQGFVNANLVGAVQQHFNVGSAKRMQIPVLPLPAQRAIAEVLGALDDKIAENARLAVITADLLVGVGALLANGNDTVPLRVLAVSRKTQVSPTGLGEVSHFSLPAFDAGAGPLAENGDSILSAKLKIERPSVLVSRLNPRIPRIWEVPEVPERPALTSTEFLVLEPVGVSTAALWAVLAQPSVSSRLQELARGTSGSHQRVHPDEVLAVGVADARQFSDDQAELVVSLSRRRQAAQAESRLLAEFRDTLLPHLMSGRLSVREAEQRVGELL